MDRKINIEQNTPVQNSFGEMEDAWAVFVQDVPANVQPIKGVETFDLDQVVATADTKFKIRYRSDLDNKMRIIYESREYDIHSIIELGRREGLELMASVVNP